MIKYSLETHLYFNIRLTITLMVYKPETVKRGRESKILERNAVQKLIIGRHSFTFIMVPATTLLQLLSRAG